MVSREREPMLGIWGLCP